MLADPPRSAPPSVAVAEPPREPVRAPRMQAPSVRAGEGLQSVAPAGWDTLLRPGQGALGHGYLSAWEHVGLAGLRSRPLLARAGHGGQLAAAAPGYFYDLDPTCLKRPAPPTWLRFLRRLHERLLMFRVYELGGPAALSDPLLHTAGGGVAQAAELLIPAAIAEAERGGAQVIAVQDFPRSDGPCAPVFRQHGFVPVPILPTVVLELGFPSFEAYLGAMRAQYRRRARRVIETSSGLRVERLHDFGHLSGELARLAREVYERAAEVKREILTESYFAAAARREDLSLLVLRRRDGTIASYALLLDDRPWLQFLNCGFEAQAREEGAYFRLLYEIVRVGIDERFGRINFGITTLPPKLDVGGVPVPLVAWVRYHRRLVQGLCGVAADRVFKVEPVQARRVFKDPERRTFTPS